MEFLASIHPKVVHFPIAFLMLYPIMELLLIITRKSFFSKAAFLFLVIGVVGSVFAVLSGNQAFELVNSWTNESREIFDKHQTFANLTIWYFLIILIGRYFLFRKQKLNRTIISVLILLSLLGSYFVYQAGNYGGKLAEKVIIFSNSPNGVIK